MKRILRYLNGTLHHGLLLQPAPLNTPIKLIAFSDADWGSDPDDRKSTSGSLVYLGPNLVSWWSKKQTLVARSHWGRVQKLGKYCSWGAMDTIPTLRTENSLSNSWHILWQPQHCCIVSQPRTPWELDIFFLREKVMSKTLIVQHLPATDQVAYLLTKPLSANRFLTLKQQLRVVDKTTASTAP